MKKIHSLVLLIACFVTTACGSSSSGLDELKRLCEKDAGLAINKTVEVDGYYDTTADSSISGRLARTDYQYFEFCDDKPAFTRLITEPGCWRVKRVLRTSGKCHERIDKKLSKFVVEPYPKYLKQYCVEIENIEKPVARYSYHSDPKQWIDNNGVSKFYRTDVYIKDNATSEILGRFVSYSFDENPRYTPTRSCKRLGDKYLSFIDANLIQTVLKPTGKGVSHD